MSMRARFGPGSMRLGKGVQISVLGTALALGGCGTDDDGIGSAVDGGVPRTDAKGALDANRAVDANGGVDASAGPDASDGGSDATDSGFDGGGGGDSTSGADVGASVDAGGSGDTGAPTNDSGGGVMPANCPTEPCAVGESCCVDLASRTLTCSASCPSSGALKCTEPTDCGGSTPTCCATAILSGGTLPNCTAASVSTACVPTAACPSKIAFSCTATDLVPLCAKAADCASGESCCSIHEGGETFSGCIASDIATAGNLTCL